MEKYTDQSLAQYRTAIEAAKKLEFNLPEFEIEEYEAPPLPEYELPEYKEWESNCKFYISIIYTHMFIKLF